MKKTWNRFLVNFANGIVLLLPVAVTVAIIRFVVIKVNSAILNPLVNALAPISWEQRHQVFMAKSIVFVLVIFSIALIGWGAKILVISRAFTFGESIFVKVPFLGKIYSASKQIFNSLLGQNKTLFKQVVLVEYPRQGLYTIGFTTGVTKGEIRDSVGRSGVNVFVPTTPNPTSGFFLVIPREELHILKMSVEDGLKMVISGGSVSPGTLPAGETDEWG